ncbi:hypothetical protein [Paenibacillus sp. N3.4]|uniref:hypothetical protein n=1 Tax=Paenibacillus sp. N3.4 TaxID=2603222 RepID=UPI0011C9B9B0|nr:hypothetical protein [Paenibacillus sp. N3.4]TXK73833.1 hypothetical protein FU659_30330 [Paenibacillus sp. N3.4]
MKKTLLVTFLAAIFVVGCSEKKQIDRQEHVDIYKAAYKALFKQEASSYNHSTMTYLLVRTDNLDLTDEEKNVLLNDMKQESGVEVGEGDYSDIERNLSNHKFGGMAIELENIRFRTDGKILLISRKTFLGTIQMRQTIERKENSWITTKKDHIVRSK